VYSSQCHISIDWHDTGVYSAPTCRVRLCVNARIVLLGGVMGGFVPIPVVRVLILTMLYVLGGFEGLLILPFLPGEKRSEKIRGREGGEVFCLRYVGEG